jgi:Ca2+-binding RTX toxin-like protein
MRRSGLRGVAVRWSAPSNGGRTRRAVAVVAGAATLLIPVVGGDVAEAATLVSTTPDGGLLIQDTTGAVDAFTVSRSPFGFVVQSAPAIVGGQALQAGTGCTLDNNGPAQSARVTCTAPNVTLNVVMNLGEGNDRVDFDKSQSSTSGAASPTNATIHAEGGNDTITGCDGADTLDGGDGDDTIKAEPLNSCDPSAQLLSPPPAQTKHLIGGAGNDTLFDGRFSTDTYDGGAGIDTVVLSPFGVGGTDRCAFIWLASIDDIANDRASTPGPPNCTQLPPEPTDNILSSVENVDGDGSLTGSAAHNRLRAGSLDDVLVGGSPSTPARPSKLANTDDRLEGREGEDRLSGEGGNDLLLGQDGDDVLNGGPGFDTVDGGNGDDTLNASTGGDTFRGGAGDDTIEGGASVDHFTAGSGADDIDSRDGKHELIHCGSGLDDVDLDLLDTPDDDCENLEQGAVDEGPNVQIATDDVTIGSGGRARVRLHCPGQLSRRCAGRLSLRLYRRGAHGRGGTLYSIAPGSSKRVTARLSARDRRALARTDHPRGLVTSIERGTHGPKTTVRVLKLAS